jgi:hypothetical protein
MKAIWATVAAGVALWAGADVSQARIHHKKKSAAAASASSLSSSSAPAAAEASVAQQPIMPLTASDAKPVALVANTPTTTKYDPAKGFPDHNGALSAMLVVIPKGELKEFDQPAGAPRHLDRVARAEPGAQLAVKIVFVGVKPDWNGNANVTYDLQVIAPDGSIYDRSDYKNLVALRSRIVTADDPGMYDNRPSVVSMQFEPKDPVGVYKIRVVLHDNVARLDVPLEAGVELLKVGAVAAVKAPPAATVPAPVPPQAAISTPSAAAAPLPAPPAPSPATPVAAASAASSSADASMAPIPDSPAPSRKKH